MNTSSLTSALGVTAKTLRGLGDVSVAGCYTDTLTEYKAIRESAGIIDGHGYAILSVSGDASSEVLDTIVTKDIQFLNSGAISECAVLDSQANMKGTVFVEKGDDDYRILIPPESKEGVLALLQDHQCEVQITDLSERQSLFFLEGPLSWRLMKEVFELDIESLPLRGFMECEYQGVSFTVSRIGRSGEYGYAVRSEQGDLPALAERLLSHGDGTVKLCGINALEVCMLEIRQPNLVFEQSEAGNLMELGQNWLIQFDKDNYYGRDAVMLAFDQERKIGSVGFLLEDKSESVDGAEVTLGDNVVGKVLYSMYSPTAKSVLGIVLLDWSLAVAGIPLTLRIGDTEVAPIRTISSPFVRPMSWDQKME